jgi:hypothetical protein
MMMPGRYKKMHSGKLLYQFLQSDAWGTPIKLLSVYNREEKNVILEIPSDEDAKGKKRKKREKRSRREHTISSEALKKIADILDGAGDVYAVENSAYEFAPVLDGTIERLSFVTKRYRKTVTVLNLGYFARQRKTRNKARAAEEFPNAERLLELLDRVGEVLEAEGVPAEWMSM